MEDDSIILNILIRRSTFMDIFYNTVRDKTQISSFFVGNLYFREKIRYLLFHTKNDTVIRNYILDMYREQKTGDYLQHSYTVFCGADETPRKQCEYSG